MANTLAYGFINLEDVMSLRVTEVGVERVMTAVQESVAEHNRQVDALMKWVERTTKIKHVVELPGTSEMQPLDEDGNPLPTKGASQYEVGYPLRMFGDAWGLNRLSRAKQTVLDYNREILRLLRGDAKNIVRSVLSALFTNVEYTYRDEFLGNVTVKPLANDDAVEYTFMGDLAPATHSHYLAQLSVINDDNNPFPDIYTTISEHSVNNDTVVSFIPTGLVDSVTSLVGFVEVADTELAYGDNVTLIRDEGEARMMEIKGPGNRVWGRVDNVWIVEWKSLPANYILSIAMDADIPALAMREDEEPSLQGLFEEMNDIDGNHMEYRILRYFGMGVQNRVGATVTLIGSATYAIPSGYDARDLFRN